MAEENNKNVVSDELDEKVKNPEVEVEREEISDKELNEVSGGVRKNNLEACSIGLQIRTNGESCPPCAGRIYAS